MRILHCCLSCFYIDGHGYQENELVRQHVEDGHDVYVIASTETFSSDGKLCYTRPSEYLGADGAPVTRLPYRKWLPERIMRKLRFNTGVYKAIARFRPDAILFHGACGWELRTVARYVERHPKTLFYVDSHEDWNNSAKGIVSRELLHKLFYGFVLRSVIPAVRKILCVSTETMDFVQQVYRVPASLLELFPLGGHPIPTQDYAVRRSKIRNKCNIAADQILFIQSGKQSRRKKLVEALRAFAKVPDQRLRLFIVGVIQDDIRSEVATLVDADRRVSHLGWKSTEELTDLLCAADVYLQPGTQSATMQHSLCCHCAVILDDVPSHQLYLQGNGWLLNSQLTLEGAIASAANADLPAMQERSYSLARRMLDYSALSKRVLRAEP